MKDILSLDASPPLLTVPDPFIPLPLSDTPGNQNWVYGGGVGTTVISFIILTLEFYFQAHLKSWPFVCSAEHQQVLLNSVVVVMRGTF